MNSSISLKLRSPLKKRLEKRAKELKIKTTTLIVKALEDFLYLEQINGLRTLLAEIASKNGYFSEEDVFKKIS